MEMESNPVPASRFFELGGCIMQKTPKSAKVQDRRFRGIFGASPAVCARVWSIIRAEVLRGGMPVHLLWALLFLKLYNIEHVHSALVGADEKTFRKWCWVFVKILSGLKIVRIYTLQHAGEYFFVS